MRFNTPAAGLVAARRLAGLYSELCRVAPGQPLPRGLVDGCVWWWPWLLRRRRAPWTSMRSALAARLFTHAHAARGACPGTLWGALHAIDFAPYREAAWRGDEPSGLPLPAIEARHQATGGSDP